MKKFRNIPALVTLLAGFVACVMMIWKKYALVDFLWILVAVMVGFYVIGILVRLILNIVFKSEKPDDNDKDGGDDKDGTEDKESGEEAEENKESGERAGKA